MRRKSLIIHPRTAKDALERWDAGETVFSVELGGLGPAYEQAIQVLVFEILRDNIGKPLPAENSNDSETWADSTITRIDEQIGGASGAMVGVAKCLAYRVLKNGWEATLEEFPSDRKIQVNNRPLPRLQ